MVQVRNVLENTLPFNDPSSGQIFGGSYLQPFDLSFFGMVSAGDYYNWLLGPVRGFVLNGNLPYQIVDKAK